MVPSEIQMAGPEAVRIYKRAIKNGTSERLAETLALRKAPSLKTDTQWLAGRGSLLDQFEGDEEYLNTAIRKARKAGFTPSENQVYLESLASEEGDPEAWVSSRDDVQRVRERKRLRPAMKDVALAEDLVQEEIGKRIAENPDLAHKDKRELREQVIDQHSYK